MKQTQVLIKRFLCFLRIFLNVIRIPWLGLEYILNIMRFMIYAFLLQLLYAALVEVSARMELQK